MDSKDSRKEHWDNSYRNRDNFVFYPHEEVIRFVSKYIRKRIGLYEFKDIYSFKDAPKLLDLGCGIGRHIIYAFDMGIEAYGIDLSHTAVEVALEWAKQKNINNPFERIKQGDICNLPWPDSFYNFAISHGVLDSMTFENAKHAIKEVARVMVKDGLFYCDLISGDDSLHSREYAGEEFVTTDHEYGTIQSYFNNAKINTLFGSLFDIVENILIKRENIISGGYISRYHLVLRRR